MDIKVFSNEWQFFQRNIGGWPVSVRYDMAVGHLAEDARKLFPHAIELTIPYDEANENGFPTKAEMERVNAIEDGFSGGAYDVRLIGVLTGGNCSRFVFCWGGEDGDVANIIQTLMGVHREAKHVPKVLLNDNFGYFDRVVAPDAYEKNRIMNQAVCDNLQKHGEAFNAPRTIDFYCYFASEQHLHVVAEKLCAQGFIKGNIGKTEQGDYGLHVTMEGVPNLDWINEITEGILNLLEGTDGMFDGWGCPTMTGA